jgi:gamma-glutamyltranspeptidase
VEAMRHTFAIRMSLSDPAYFSNVTAEAVKDLTSGPYMENLRKITLDNSTLRLSQYGGTKWAQLNDGQGDKDIEDHHEGDRRLRSGFRRKLARTFGYLDDFGTSHLSVVDKDGNAVAITSSVNQIFGSRIFSESTGVVMGDTMDGKLFRALTDNANIISRLNDFVVGVLTTDFGNPGRSNFYGLKPSEANFISPGKRVSRTST